MATAQVVSATPALHDEKIEEQPVADQKPQDHHDIKKINDNIQETTAVEPAPQPSEEAPPKEPTDDTPAAPTPDQPEPEPEPKAEPEALAAEVETKVVLKEADDDQPAKVAPEPCVLDEAAKESEVEAAAEAKTEPVEVTKAEAEAEDKVVEKEEGGAADN